MLIVDRGNEGDLENNADDYMLHGGSSDNEEEEDDVASDGDDVEYSSVRNSTDEEGSDEDDDDDMDGVTIDLLERLPLTPLLYNNNTKQQGAANELLRQTHAVSMNIMCQRTSSSARWYLPLSVHSISNKHSENDNDGSSILTTTTTLRIVDESSKAIGNSTTGVVPNEYRHGLLPDDVIVSINGQMVGGQELPNLGAILNVMRSNLLHLKLGIRRKDAAVAAAGGKEEQQSVTVDM